RDYDASLAAWGKVFELNPKFTDFRYGQALIFAGQFGAGLAAIERHMRLDPFSPPAAYIFLGLAYLPQKPFAEAILPFQEVIARAPQLARGRMLLATTLALMGRMDEAHAQIAELLRIEPDCTQQDRAAAILPLAGRRRTHPPGLAARRPAAVS